MQSVKSRLAAEIGHVLLLDIVAYSRRSMEEQSRWIRELRDVVRKTPEYQRADVAGELIGLDTGDGMALVFFRDPVGPAQCAVEIARATALHPDLRLRVGIHSGPVSREIDINGRPNVSGSGINMAQRVMEFGDPGHILMSRSTAEFVGQFEAWSESLRDLGAHEAKHGARLHLYNLVMPNAGNCAVPASIMTVSKSPVPIGSDPSVDQSAQELDWEDLEPAGGAVPLDSPFYVERAADRQFQTAIARHDSIVLVRGARQIGKTSLLARGLQQARNAGAKVIFTDLQKLTGEQLSSTGSLFRHLAEVISEQLDLDLDCLDAWDSRRSWNVNIERFLRRNVLSHTAARVIWGIDEVDRLFTCPFGSEVFGLFRSWHNERSLDPEGPWRRLTLAMAYATEAHLFITDLNQSPFNVGTRLSLEDFTPSQVSDLNDMYGSPLRSSEDLARFSGLVSGHPYLVRRALEELVSAQTSIAELERAAARDDGPFGDHLRRISYLISKDIRLSDALRAVLRGRPTIQTTEFYRLRSAGLLVGESARDAAFRCRLYRQYLENHLSLST